MKEGTRARSDSDPIAVFKLGERRYMQELLEKGHVYLNQLSWFRLLEARDPRADQYEAASYSRPADGGTLSVQVGAEFQEVADLVGPFVRISSFLGSVNIYSMHFRSRRDYGALLNLHELQFGDTAVVFLDAMEFIRRFKRAAKAIGQEVHHGPVEYVHPGTHRGEMGPFRKFDRFAGQREFRLALTPGTGKPLSLHLGPLVDIAMMVPAASKLKLEPKQTTRDKSIEQR